MPSKGLTIVVTPLFDNPRSVSTDMSGNAAALVAALAVSTAVAFLWPVWLESWHAVLTACGCRRGKGCPSLDEDAVNAAAFVSQLLQVPCTATGAAGLGLSPVC